MKKILAVVLGILIGGAIAFWGGQQVASKQFVKGFAADSQTLILKEKNTLTLNDVVDDKSVAKIMQKAMEMDNILPPNEVIYLVMNTPGGSIQAGLELITFLKGLKHKIHTVTIFAASMGFITVQTLDTRYITYFGTLMAHKARGGFEGELPGQMENRLNFYLRKLDAIDKIIVKRFKGKISLEQYRSLYENEYWVDGFEAIDKNMADQVVNVRCDKELNDTFVEEIFFFGLKINVTWSKCPMITGPVDIKVEKPEKDLKVSWKKVHEKIESLKNRSNYNKWTPQQIKNINK